MRVLVIGGSRFNGLALVALLAARGYDVSVFNRGLSGEKLPGGVRTIRGDRQDHAGVRERLRGRRFDAVVDFAGYEAADVRALVQALDGHCGHYVFISSCVIYAPSTRTVITESDPVERGPRQTEYGIKKLECEDWLWEAARSQGLHATVVAFAMMGGPRNFVRDREQKMFERLLTGRPVLLPGDGSTVIQYGHVQDGAAAIASVLGKVVAFGKRYNVGGSDAFTDRKYIEVVASVMGVDPKVHSVAAPVMTELWEGRLAADVALPRMASTGIPVGTSSATLSALRSLGLLRLAPSMRRWDEGVFMSSDRLRADTGWLARNDIRSLLSDAWEWYRQPQVRCCVDHDFSFEDTVMPRLLARKALP